MKATFLFILGHLRSMNGISRYCPNCPLWPLICKHRKNCESCPTQVSWKVLMPINFFVCPVCPVCPVLPVGPVPPISSLDDCREEISTSPWLVLWHFSPELVAKCFPKWPAWKVVMVVFVRKLEVDKSKKILPELKNILHKCHLWQIPSLWRYRTAMAATNNAKELKTCRCFLSYNN